METRTLIENGMYDVLLMDRGNGPVDAVKRVMMSPGVFDSVLAEIVDGRQSITPLPTTEFSYTNPSLYSRQMEEYRNRYLTGDITNGIYICFQGINLAALGGHYAAFYVTPEAVTVSDSMTTSAGPGPYTTFFAQIGGDLFPDRRVVIDQVGAGEQGLQPTGGFLWLLPSFARGNSQVSLLDPLTLQLIQTSNIESQDHFCWAWSILYLHARVAGVELTGLRRWLYVTGFPQLALIKMYTWLWLIWLRKDSLISLELRRDYFALWDAESRLDPNDYRRYKLALAEGLSGQTLTEVDQLLQLVMRPGAVTVTRTEEMTPVPMSCL